MEKSLKSKLEKKMFYVGIRYIMNISTYLYVFYA